MTHQVPYYLDESTSSFDRLQLTCGCHLSHPMCCVFILGLVKFFIFKKLRLSLAPPFFFFFSRRSRPYVRTRVPSGNGWELKVSELEARLATALAAGTVVKALVIIAPGNPTGQTLSEENMAALITFCADKGLVLLADEVYQENIYIDNYEFVSFKKVATQMAQSNSAVSKTHFSHQNIPCRHLVDARTTLMESSAFLPVTPPQQATLHHIC